MTTEAHLASLDATLAAARQAWEADRKGLEDRLFALQTELKLTQDACARAETARTAAERITMKLITQFGMVAGVFAEARDIALQCGYTEPEKPDPTEAAKAAIDRALNPPPVLSLENTTGQQGTAQHTPEGDVHVPT